MKNDVGSNEQIQAYAVMTKRKGKFGKFEPRMKFKRKLTCLKSSAMNVMNMVISKEIVLNAKGTTRKGRKEMKPMSSKKQNNRKKRRQRRKK